jgi:hypothetical protein
LPRAGAAKTQTMRAPKLPSAFAARSRQDVPVWRAQRLG